MIRFIIIFYSCLSISFAFGQVIVPEKDNEFDKKYTPGQNSIFNGLNKNNRESSGGGDIEIKNGIKVAPTMLFRQQIAFFYERSIINGLSIYAGAGKAFGSDYIQLAAFGLFSGFRSTPILSTSDILNYSTYDGSSALLAAGAKIYFSGKTFDESFISFNYEHLRLDYLLNESIYDRPVQGSREASFNMNYYSFGFGYTFLGGDKGNIISEFYANVGVKLFRVSQYERVDYNQPMGSSVGYYRKLPTDMDARIIPAFSIGYILGFGF